MFNREQERAELLSEIQKRGYDSLRFSIFNDHNPWEWETRIELNPQTQKYEVYLTRDRAGKGRVFEYSDFTDAKEKFLELLNHTVSRNKYYISNGWVPQYPSPLWDKLDIDIESLKNLVEKEIKERGFESLYYVLFDEDSRKPWATHLFFKDNKFQINSRDERSYIVGKTWEFDTIKEAKDEFFKILSQTVHA